MQILIWGDNMKKQIRVCIFLSVVLIALSLAFIKFNNTKKEYELKLADHTQLTEETEEQETHELLETESDTTQEENEYMFCILEKDNQLVVYEAKTDKFYMETGINTQDLPIEIQEHLKNGIFLKTESDLYDFLESYSS